MAYDRGFIEYTDKDGAAAVIPSADSFHAFTCAAPACGSLHVVLKDADGTAFAEATFSAMQLTKMMQVILGDADAFNVRRP